MRTTYLLYMKYYILSPNQTSNLNFPQIWDVLTNKEVVEIVASVPARAYAARALVESAVRAWRCKYPTSKVDDCAVVCLFFDSNPNNLSTAFTSESKEKLFSMGQNNKGNEEEDPSTPSGLNRSGTVRTGKDLAGEENKEETSIPEETQTGMEKDWSALEGVSRVNTLLTLPRLVPEKEEKRAAGGTKARKG